MNTLNNHLKVYRKQSGLSQKDIAFLVNKPSVCTISKMENNQILPDLKTIMNFSLLYQKNIQNLFPKLYETCQHEFLEKIGFLSDKYDKSKRKKDIFKLSFLENIMKGIVSNNS